MKANNANKGLGRCSPPSLSTVRTYFESNGIPGKVAEGFFYFQQAHHWKTKDGKAIVNWKVVARNWIVTCKAGNQPQTIDIKLRLQIPSGIHTVDYGG